MKIEALENSELAQRPIPTELPSVSGWKGVLIHENGEPLVPLGTFSDYRDIFTSSIYAGERRDSPYSRRPLRESLMTQFVRTSVAEQLRHAQGLLFSCF